MAWEIYSGWPGGWSGTERIGTEDAWPEEYEYLEEPDFEDEWPEYEDGFEWPESDDGDDFEFGDEEFTIDFWYPDEDKEDEKIDHSLPDELFEI